MNRRDGARDTSRDNENHQVPPSSRDAAVPPSAMVPSATLDNFLTVGEIERRVKVHRTTIYRWIKDEKFPSPVKLSEGCSRWREREVSAWVAERL